VRLRLAAVARQLDAARLAAVADLDLGLDDDGEAEFLRGLDGLGDGCCTAAVGRGQPVLLEELLALVVE
jgi:hypothetical protein